jgi:NAD dependent epimerase/dehydratase family enzyme
MENPNHITNYEFTKTLGSVLNRPTICWIPEFVLRASYFIAGEFVQETLFVNLKVIPKKLLDNEFHFIDINLKETLTKLLT